MGINRFALESRIRPLLDSPCTRFSLTRFALLDSPVIQFALLDSPCSIRLVLDSPSTRFALHSIRPTAFALHDTKLVHTWY